jgi:hypothetical protein
MKRRVSHLLGATALAALVLQTAPALADPLANSHLLNNAKAHAEQVRRDDGHRRDGRPDHGRQEYGWRAEDRDDDRWDDDRWDDDRWDDDRRHERHSYERDYYPRHGHFVTRLPHRHRVVHHHGHRYYYADGRWYQPYGPRFMVVAPPFGLVVPFLPDVYTTLYFGGVPYYRAHDAYYVWQPRARGYVVTNGPW